MTQKVLRIGNSLGVTFPRDFVEENKIKIGAEVDVKRSNGSISYTANIAKHTDYEEISDKEFIDAVNEVEALYGSALDKLAKLE